MCVDGLGGSGYRSVGVGDIVLDTLVLGAWRWGIWELDARDGLEDILRGVGMGCGCKKMCELVLWLL